MEDAKFLKKKFFLKYFLITILLGWYDGYIYRDHEKTLIYETELRLPKRVQSVLCELNLIHFNDWSLQYNTDKVNDLLWSVKSFVTITPVRLPDGLPTPENMEDFRSGLNRFLSAIFIGASTLTDMCSMS